MPFWTDLPPVTAGSLATSAFVNGLRENTDYLAQNLAGACILTTEALLAVPSSQAGQLSWHTLTWEIPTHDPNGLQNSLETIALPRDGLWLVGAALGLSTGTGTTRGLRISNPDTNLPLATLRAAHHTGPASLSLSRPLPLPAHTRLAVQTAHDTGHDLHLLDSAESPPGF